MREFAENGGISDDLLAWYDKNARDLPWRVPPNSGHHANPYAIWLSEVMLQQTTVATVKAYFLKFRSLWPTVQDLAAANDADVMAAWAGLGYYARARNLLKCARVVTDDHNGQFPNTLDELLALPGIGPYTAAAISSIAFDNVATVVDGNVERVMARVFAHTEPLPKAKKALTRLAANCTPSNRPGDYAQAVMDLGATICTPRNPKCDICPIQNHCKGLAQNIAHTLPAKTPKPPKPTRYGHVYLAQRNDGAWLLERRPEKGLLGGMLGWPGGAWGDAPSETPPVQTKWHILPNAVTHTFTHFHLVLTVHFGTVDHHVKPDTGDFVGSNAFDAKSLPTAMRKAYDAAISAKLVN